MIKDYNDNKITANQKAKDLILDRLADLDWSWCDETCNNEYQSEAMTAKEIEAVSLQIKKRINSIYRLLGYSELYNIKGDK